MKGVISAPSVPASRKICGKPLSDDVQLRLGNLGVAQGVVTVTLPAGQTYMEVPIEYGRTFSKVPKRLVCQYGNAFAIVSCGWDSESTTTGFKAYIYSPQAIEASRDVRIMWLAWET